MTSTKRGRPADLNMKRVEFMNKYIESHPMIGPSLETYYNENEELHPLFGNVHNFTQFTSKNNYKMKHIHPFENYEFPSKPIINLTQYYRINKLREIGTYQQFRNEYIKFKNKN